MPKVRMTSGDRGRVARLIDTRDRLAAAIAGCKASRDLPALCREYRLVLAEIDSLTTEEGAMSLISSPSAVAPRVRLAPPAARNDAELVVELAAAYGTAFDPWQIDVLEAGCGVRQDGLWAAQTVGCNVPAQNGKSVVLDRPGVGGGAAVRREGDHPQCA